jgi:hypothetical protein
MSTKRPTNRENLLRRFDRGEDVSDYFALEKAMVVRPGGKVAGGGVPEMPAKKGEGRTIPKNQDRTVYRREDGTWVNQRTGAERASSVHRTQVEALQAAREMLSKQGGGELTTMGVHGRIVSQDTIAPGNTSPPRDKEH